MHRLRVKGEGSTNNSLSRVLVMTSTNAEESVPVMNGRTHQSNGSQVEDTGSYTSFFTSRPNTKQRGIIYFRAIQPADRQVIQQLHEQWFPVDYTSDFFDGLCTSRVMPGTSEPLYSCVACFKEIDEEEFEDIKEQQSGCVTDGLLSFWFGRRRDSDYVHFEEYGDCILWESDETLLGNPSNGNESHLYQQSAQVAQEPAAQISLADFYDETAAEVKRETVINFYNKLNQGIKQSSANENNSPHNEIYLNESGERIVGCLIGSFLSSSRLSSKQESEERDETAALLVPDPDEYPKMFYIMTLGCVPEFRRCGLGSILVNRVVDMIETRPECGALYLHVITYNVGGMLLFDHPFQTG